MFTRDQAVAAGFTPSAVDFRLRLGAWEAVDYGVYRLAGTPGSWRQRLLAACLAGPAVASHRSAAALWHLPDHPESLIEITALRHRRRKAAGIIWHESVRLGPREVVELDGIPTTDAVRTIIDLGAVLGTEAVLTALDDATRRALATPERVARRLEAYGPRRRGTGAVRAALARRPLDSAIPESVLETSFEQLIRGSGLPTPSRQFAVRDPAGRLVARVDFAFPDQRIAVEIDGARYHSGAAEWRSDLARQNRVVAQGWRMLRFTADDLRYRRGHVAAMVRSVLEKRPPVREASLTVK